VGATGIVGAAPALGAVDAVPAPSVVGVSLAPGVVVGVAGVPRLVRCRPALTA
jgi:hypothetical protein